MFIKNNEKSTINNFDDGENKNNKEDLLSKQSIRILSDYIKL